MDDKEKREVGSRIEKIRRSNGLNMREFGELIGRHLGYPPQDSPSDSIVSRWEKGKSIPNSERLKAIAEIGSISVEELLYGSPKNYIRNLLKMEIQDNNDFRMKLKDYLDIADEHFGDISRGIFLNNDGSIMDPEQQFYKELEYQNFEMENLIENTIDEFYENEKQSLNLSINFRNKEIVVESYIDFIKQLELYHSFTFEGRYKRIKNFLNEWIPLAMGFEKDTVDTLTERELKEHNDYQKAREKAITLKAESELGNLTLDYIQKSEEIYRRYKEEMDKMK